MLTPKQQRFVDEYLVDLNATQAAIRCGYSVRTARSQGSELLTKPDISAAVVAGKSAQLASAGLSASRVLEEIRSIAFSDLRKAFDDEGQLKNVKDLDDDTARALASTKVLRTNLTSGDGSRETVHEIKMWDKLKALELAAKHFGLLEDKAGRDEPIKLEISWSA